VPATLVVGATSAIVALFELIFGRPSFGVNPAASVRSNESHYAESLTITDDLYIWNSVVLDLGVQTPA